MSSAATIPIPLPLKRAGATLLISTPFDCAHETNSVWLEPGSRAAAMVVLEVGFSVAADAIFKGQSSVSINLPSHFGH